MTDTQPWSTLAASVSMFADAHRRPPTVLVDADGVLYDWERGFVDCHRAMFPDVAVPEPGTRDQFDFFRDAPAPERERAERVLNEMSYASLGLIPGAAEAVHVMQDCGIDVVACTSPTLTNPRCESDKKAAFLRDLGASFAGDRLLIMRDKTYAVGDLLIDDKPHVSGRRAPLWRHIRFTQLYNSALPGPRIDSWVDGEWMSVLASELRGPS